MRQAKIFLPKIWVENFYLQSPHPIKINWLLPNEVVRIFRIAADSRIEKKTVRQNVRMLILGKCTIVKIRMNWPICYIYFTKQVTCNQSIKIYLFKVLTERFYVCIQHQSKEIKFSLVLFEMHLICAAKVWSLRLILPTDTDFVQNSNNRFSVFFLMKKFT